MIGTRVVWFDLLKKHRKPFLEYLRANNRRAFALTELSAKLTSFLVDKIRTREDAAGFWLATHAVLCQCDDQKTYELEMAPEAYAWLHLLDRYVRTWRALETMVQRACLPLAKYGVNVLDVGTGPGPSPLAIADFYRELSTYADSVGESSLIQPCSITAVELSWENNAFRSHFRESTLASPAETAIISDLRTINPREQRATKRRLLIDETDYFEEPVCMPETANFEAQGMYRYRLVTLSHFLTTDDVIQSARPSLEAILSDLHPGSVVLLLGGIGAQYPGIYQRFDRLATECGLRRKISDARAASTEADSKIILVAARRVADHVNALCPMLDSVPKKISQALKGGTKWGNPSAIRVYRRNKYPTRSLTNTD